MRDTVKWLGAYLEPFLREHPATFRHVLDGVRDTIQQLEQERAAALADNAATLDVARRTVEVLATFSHPLLAVTHNNLRAVVEQPHPGAALLEEHRKALVRAKNEGLEEAAQSSDDAADAAEAQAEADSASPNPDAANWANGAANEARNIATVIRSKKAPES